MFSSKNGEKTLNQINKKHKLVPGHFWNLVQRIPQGIIVGVRATFVAFTLGFVGAGRPDVWLQGEAPPSAVLTLLCGSGLSLGTCSSCDMGLVSQETWGSLTMTCVVKSPHSKNSWLFLYFLLSACGQWWPKLDHLLSTGSLWMAIDTLQFFSPNPPSEQQAISPLSLSGTSEYWDNGMAHGPT